MRNRVQIAIVGGSGSGKSWLAENLCAALAPKAARLSLDDFYRDLSPMRAEERARVNFDEPAAIDWGCVREAMEALSRGAPAKVPIYDFATHTRRRRRRLVAPHDFIVWDGLWLLHEKWLRQQFALSVFVDCPGQERLTRRVARDARDRGRKPGSVRRQFREHVEPMHMQYVEPQRRWATCCVVSPVNEQALDRLLEQVRNFARRNAPTAQPRTRPADSPDAR